MQALKSYFFFFFREYYFSEENLQKDFFFRRRMNKEGYCAVSLVASFNRVQALTKDISKVLEVIFFFLNLILPVNSCHLKVYSCSI